MSYSVVHEPIHPFFCGSQYLDWAERNCFRCSLHPGHEEPSDPEMCEIDDAILSAQCGDGSVPESIAHRMGYIGNENQLTWDCPERQTMPGMQAIFSDRPGYFWWAHEVLGAASRSLA